MNRLLALHAYIAVVMLSRDLCATIMDSRVVWGSGWFVPDRVHVKWPQNECFNEPAKWISARDAATLLRTGMLSMPQKPFCLVAGLAERARQADELRDLVEFMREEIIKEDIDGITAIQVGVPLKLVVLASGASLLNPRIIYESEKKSSGQVRCLNPRKES